MKATRWIKIVRRRIPLRHINFSFSVSSFIYFFRRSKNEEKKVKGISKRDDGLRNELKRYKRTERDSADTVSNAYTERKS